MTGKPGTYAPPPRTAALFGDDREKRQSLHFQGGRRAEYGEIERRHRLHGGGTVVGRANHRRCCPCRLFLQVGAVHRTSRCCRKAQGVCVHDNEEVGCSGEGSHEEEGNNQGESRAPCKRDAAVKPNATGLLLLGGAQRPQTLGEPAVSCAARVLHDRKDDRLVRSGSGVGPDAVARVGCGGVAGVAAEAASKVTASSRLPHHRVPRLAHEVEQRVQLELGRSVENRGHPAGKIAEEPAEESGGQRDGLDGKGSDGRIVEDIKARATTVHLGVRNPPPPTPGEVSAQRAVDKVMLGDRHAVGGGLLTEDDEGVVVAESVAEEKVAGHEYKACKHKHKHTQAQLKRGRPNRTRQPPHPPGNLTPHADSALCVCACADTSQQ